MAWSRKELEEWERLIRQEGVAPLSSPTPSTDNIPTWEVTHKEQERMNNWKNRQMKTHEEVREEYEAKRFANDVRSDIMLLPELKHGSPAQEALGEMDY